MSGDHTEEHEHNMLKGAEKWLNGSSHESSVATSFPIDHGGPNPEGLPKVLGPQPGAEEENMMHPDVDDEQEHPIDNWS